MEIITANLSHVFAAFTFGIVIGLFLRCKLALFLIITCVSSGLVALVAVSDWSVFFKDGISVGHLIHLAGNFLIAVVFFGPFGSVSAIITRLIKYFLHRRLICNVTNK